MQKYEHMGRSICKAGTLTAIAHFDKDVTDKEVRDLVTACNSHADLLEAGSEMHLALYDLRRAYEAVQKHYGLAPETSSFLVAAESALKNWTMTIARAEGRQ